MTLAIAKIYHGNNSTVSNNNPGISKRNLLIINIVGYCEITICCVDIAVVEIALCGEFVCAVRDACYVALCWCCAVQIEVVVLAVCFKIAVIAYANFR